MRPDGTDMKQLTTGANDRCHRFSPVWSPDARRIAYTEELVIV